MKMHEVPRAGFSQAPLEAASVGRLIWPRLFLYVADLALKLQLPHLNRKPFPGAIGVAVSVLRSL